MKRIIFVILLSAAAVGTIDAGAQSRAPERKFSLATTMGTALPVMSTPPCTPFTWQILGYYNLTTRWSLGAGTGVSLYERALISLYGDVRFQIGRERRFTPYAEVASGYSFALSGDANGGFFLNPSFGVHLPLRNKMRLQLAVGYELQELSRLKKHADSYFAKEFAEHLSHNSISIKVGVRF